MAEEVEQEVGGRFRYQFDDSGKHMRWLLAILLLGGASLPLLVEWEDVVDADQRKNEESEVQFRFLHLRDALLEVRGSRGSADIGIETLTATLEGEYESIFRITILDDRDMEQTSPQPGTTLPIRICDLPVDAFLTISKVGVVFRVADERATVAAEIEVSGAEERARLRAGEAFPLAYLEQLSELVSTLHVGESRDPVFCCEPDTFFADLFAGLSRTSLDDTAS